jgi:hypothetical protein
MCQPHYKFWRMAAYSEGDVYKANNTNDLASRNFMVELAMSLHRDVIGNTAAKPPNAREGSKCVYVSGSHRSLY